MNTKALVFSFAAFAISSVAQAAPQLDCRATDQYADIQALALSQNGKEIQIIVPSAIVHTKLVIKNVETKGQDVTISGSVESIENMQCPGSCPTQTFVLEASNKRSSPNSSLVITSEGYDERVGGTKVSKQESKFNCSVNGFEAAKNKVELMPGTFNVWASKDLSSDCEDGVKVTLDKGQVTGNIALLENTMMGSCDKEIDYNPRFVKLTSVTKGACGEIIMTGAVPEGSWYYTVEIVDNRSLTCRMMPEAQIVLKYIKGGHETKFYSYGQQ